MAYVFVRALPEMSDAQEVFTRVTFDRGIPFPELHVYTAALIGFLFFYGLEHMASRSDAPDRVQANEAAPLAYRLQLGGFALYGGLVGYLMVHQRTLPTLLYLVAMALHFLGVDHSLEREYGSHYDGDGRWLLAATILAGGFAGMSHAGGTAGDVAGIKLRGRDHQQRDYGAANGKRRTLLAVLPGSGRVFASLAADLDDRHCGGLQDIT